MADPWENLPTASLAGIPFPIASRKVRGGRALARKKYPFRAGQVTEDIAREPRVYEYVIPLFAGMHDFVGFPEPLYPDAYSKLIALCESDDSQAYAELIDPEHGAVQVKIVGYEWDEKSDARNGGILSLTIEEEEPAPFELFTITTDASASALDWAADFDAELSLASLVPELPPGFASFAALVADFVRFVGDLEATADAVAARLDEVRATITAAQLAALELPAAFYRVAWAGTSLLDSVTLSAQAATSLGPSVVEWTVPATMSSHEIAAELYGDASRYGEIESRNPSAHPLFYPAGTTLLVLAR